MSPREIGRAVETLANGKGGSEVAFHVIDRTAGGAAVPKTMTRAEVARELLVWIGAAG